LLIATMRGLEARPMLRAAGRIIGLAVRAPRERVRPARTIPDAVLHSVFGPRTDSDESVGRSRVQLTAPTRALRAPSGWGAGLTGLRVRDPSRQCAREPLVLGPAGAPPGRSLVRRVHGRAIGLGYGCDEGARTAYELDADRIVEL